MTEIRTHGLWFEEFEKGLTLETRGRTITEADIVNFAGLTGDYNPMHTDAEYAKTTQFGARIAHGALTFSYSIGLLYQLGFIEQTVIAFTAFEMKMRQPLYIGDTMRVAVTVTGTRAMPSAGGGLVTFDIKITKQDGKIAQKGEMTLMIKSQPAAGENPPSEAEKA